MKDYVVARDSDGLTASERTIVEYLVAGHRQSWIAHRLGISRQRVSWKVKALIKRGVIQYIHCVRCQRCHGRGERIIRRTK